MCVQNRPQALSVIWSFHKQNPALLFVMVCDAAALHCQFYRSAGD